MTLCFTNFSLAQCKQSQPSSSLFDNMCPCKICCRTGTTPLQQTIYSRVSLITSHTTCLVRHWAALIIVRSQLRLACHATHCSALDNVGHARALKEPVRSERRDFDVTGCRGSGRNRLEVIYHRIRQYGSEIGLNLADVMGIIQKIEAVMKGKDADRIITFP